MVQRSESALMTKETGKRLITWKEVILHPGKEAGDLIAMSAFSDMQNNRLVAAALLESAVQFVAV